jgi:hypothetical protein
MTVWDDGSGPALYVGGSFIVAGDVIANNIAKWNGSLWSTVGHGTGGNVYALTVYNGELIAGGSFGSIDGVAMNSIARWDGASWSRLGDGFQGGFPEQASVYALSVYNSELVAGGNFSIAGGVYVSSIARWNGARWSGLAAGGVGGTYFSGVLALAIYDNQLIAGGYFTNAGGVPANHIASWNGNVWSPLGSGMNDPVRCLTVYNGELIAGGGFVSAGGITANGIARWNGASWSTR